MNFVKAFLALFLFVTTVNATDIKTVAYGTDPRQQMDIYTPANSDHAPILIFVHGGAWHVGDKNQHVALGNFYAKQGIRTVIVNYRLSPTVLHPSHVQDVAAATAYVKTHLKNPKIYLMGHSCGANMVALLVTNDKYLKEQHLAKSDISGVVAVSGIYNLGTNMSLVGLGHIFPDKSDASPIRFVQKDCPPFLLFYGDSDYVTLATQARKFHNALKNKGVSSKLLVVKGADHYSVVQSVETANSAATTEIIAFVR